MHVVHQVVFFAAKNYAQIGVERTALMVARAFAVAEQFGFGSAFSEDSVPLIMGGDQGLAGWFTSQVSNNLVYIQLGLSALRGKEPIDPYLLLAALFGAEVPNQIEKHLTPHGIRDRAQFVQDLVMVLGERGVGWKPHWVGFPTPPPKPVEPEKK